MDSSSSSDVTVTRAWRFGGWSDEERERIEHSWRESHDRAVALDHTSATDLTDEERDNLERDRAKRFRWCEHHAKRANLPLQVSRESSFAELNAFAEYAIQVDLELAERVEREVLEGPMTREQRVEWHKQIAGFSRVTAADILDSAAQGMKGIAAIEHAARKYQPVSAIVKRSLVATAILPAVDVSVNRQRPREHSSCSATRARPPDDSGPLPPPPRRRHLTGTERRGLARLIDQAVRARNAERRWCPNCARWLEPDLFGRGCSACRSCETLRVGAAYHRRKVAE